MANGYKRHSRKRVKHFEKPLNNSFFSVERAGTFSPSPVIERIDVRLIDESTIDHRHRDTHTRINHGSAQRDRTLHVFRLRNNKGVSIPIGAGNSQRVTCQLDLSKQQTNEAQTSSEKEQQPHPDTAKS